MVIEPSGHYQKGWDGRALERHRRLHRELVLGLGDSLVVILYRQVMFMSVIFSSFPFCWTCQSQLLGFMLGFIGFGGTEFFRREMERMMEMLDSTSSTPVGLIGSYIKLYSIWYGTVQLPTF